MFSVRRRIFIISKKPPVSEELFFIYTEFLCMRENRACKGMTAYSAAVVKALHSKILRLEGHEFKS